MSADLLPCPFCGSAPRVVDPDVSRGLYEVGCPANWSNHFPCAVGPAADGVTRHEAIAAWNRRASRSPDTGGAEPVAEMGAYGAIKPYSMDWLKTVPVGTKLYASQPAPETVGVTEASRLSYAKIIEIVDECSERMKRKGESHRMFAKWVSEGINAALARNSVEGTRDSVIEECAKVAEDYPRSIIDIGNNNAKVLPPTQTEIVAAIRALKGSTNG